ncbi:WhiB family transcription factor [Mycobacterium phage Chaser]|uniref:WhiB family transcription factor n=1 Tax=Mycobacterium phage DyoEdafos TaxID=2599860 RepID=A0A5J6TNK7_9CAUD|nr:transcriptional regulator WhiB-like [Mycobacterium phage DyoEdafos]QFG10302.1 WhiB family transcription factor [Mycobacterium phage DyoEdafos]QXO14307.1 WhiB family transcription factor [Mycobacterium phage Chaser]
MSAEIKALMSPKPLHWTEEAVCHDDRRFTGRYSDLSTADISQMISKCSRCPVYEQCGDWAVREQVIEVFAAGYWRSDGRVTEPD